VSEYKSRRYRTMDIGGLFNKRKQAGLTAAAPVSELCKRLQPSGIDGKGRNATPLILLGFAVLPAIAFLAWEGWSKFSEMVTRTFGAQPAGVQVLSFLILVSVLGIVTGLIVNAVANRVTKARWLTSRLEWIQARRKMAVYVSGSGALGFIRSLEDPKTAFTSILSMVVFSHPPMSAVKSGGISANNAVVATAPVQDAMANLEAALQGRSEETHAYQEGHDDFMQAVGGGETTVEWDILHLGEGHTSESCHLAWADERTTSRVGANPSRNVVVVRDKIAQEGSEPNPHVPDNTQSDGPGAPVREEPSLETALGSVVRVISDNSSGSGVIVHSDGFVATCAHVLDEADEVEVWFPDGYSSDAEVVAQDPNSDVALIRCRV
jgi:S1-C subfamily serine protease